MGCACWHHRRNGKHCLSTGLRQQKISLDSLRHQFCPARLAPLFYLGGSALLSDFLYSCLHAKGDLVSIASHELLPDLGPLTS